jgi:hypothetical protein
MGPLDPVKSIHWPRRLDSMESGGGPGRGGEKQKRGFGGLPRRWHWCSRRAGSQRSAGETPAQGDQHGSHRRPRQSQPSSCCDGSTWPLLKQTSSPPAAVKGWQCGGLGEVVGGKRRNGKEVR